MSEAASARVLLVSDDRALEAAVARTLEGVSDEAVVAAESTASAAVDRLRSDAFDCVVSTYDLPEGDGVAFLETVRARHPDLSFVLYASEGSEAVAADAVSAGVTEYVLRDPATDEHAALVDAVEDTVGAASETNGASGRSARLDQILKTVPGCVAQLDEGGRFTYANERAEEVLGLERSQLTERTYNDPEWEIKDADGNPIPDAELPFRRVWDSGEPLYDYQHSIRWPDGSEKILSVSGAPLFDERGAVESVVFSMSDVTEQTRRERELKRYRQIVEHIDDVATIIDPDGTITYVSPAVERVLGYEPEDLIGDNGFGYQPPETSDAVADAIERALADPTESHTVQTKFRRADGSWCWIESTLQNRLDDDAIDGILVSSRDVTGRLKQERRIAQRERQLNRLHEATRELLRSGTSQEVAATASRTAVDILDLPLNGIHFYDDDTDGLAPVAVSESSRELFDEVPTIDEGIAWEAFQSGEARVYADLDEASEVYNVESPIRSEMHLPLGDRGVFIISSTTEDAFEETDVELAKVLAANTAAALKRISDEQQLRSRERELEQQNERLEEFASIVSHDLRNPLNIAQARTELLAADVQSEHLAPIEEALDRMEQLVSDTLTLARQGNVVAETEPIRLTNLVGKCWKTVSTEDATIEVVDDVVVYGDRSRLLHVFENLFRNAIEHGGADVTVRVGRFDDDGIYVADTGGGIPEAKRETVFEPGQSSATDGTGFGLTIIKRIVEAHGWQVAVAAGDEGGARFEFTGLELTGQ